MLAEGFVSFLGRSLSHRRSIYMLRMEEDCRTITVFHLSNSTNAQWEALSWCQRRSGSRETAQRKCRQTTINVHGCPFRYRWTLRGITWSRRLISKNQVRSMVRQWNHSPFVFRHFHYSFPTTTLLYIGWHRMSVRSKSAPFDRLTSTKKSRRWSMQMIIWVLFVAKWLRRIVIHSIHSWSRKRQTNTATNDFSKMQAINPYYLANVFRR